MDTKLLPRAKKSLGQNFLQDANIARKIVEALELEKDDDVIEIGPGPGALTKLIVKEPFKRLVIIEKDDDFAVEHAQKFTKGEPSSSLLEAISRAEKNSFGVAAADALKVSWNLLQGDGWKFIGNLPYNIASPLMWDIVSQSRVKRAVFMVQKEVAERIVAKPGTSAYGGLSVWIQSFVTPKMLFTVPPQVFFPRPKVHSAVLVFTPLKDMCYDFDKDKLAKLIKSSFIYRRKQFGTIFKKIPDIELILKKYAICKEQRPETLTPRQFHELSKEILL